jgi:hypothetical protein
VPRLSTPTAAKGNAHACDFEYRGPGPCTGFGRRSGLEKDNRVDAVKFIGAAAGHGRTKDRTLSFTNKRAATWWAFREALDPDQRDGSPICLPDDPALRADLAAPQWELTSRGILIEDKDELRKRLGRSPDKGDAVVMAWHSGQRALRRGATATTFGGVFRPERQKFAKVDERHARVRRIRHIGRD